jgi:hypothetical protein
MIVDRGGTYEKSFYMSGKIKINVREYRRGNQKLTINPEKLTP